MKGKSSNLFVSYLVLGPGFGVTRAPRLYCRRCLRASQNMYFDSPGIKVRISFHVVRSAMIESTCLLTFLLGALMYVSDRAAKKDLSMFSFMLVGDFETLKSSHSLLDDLSTSHNLPGLDGDKVFTTVSMTSGAHAI